MKGLKKIHEEPLQWLYTITLAAIIFYFYYLVMRLLPGGGSSRACLIGGALTIQNLIFSALISFLTAITISGLFRLYLNRKSVAKNVKTGSVMGFGFLLGFLTVFCTLCTIPVITVFGFAVGLGFFTTYNLVFKTLSLILMVIALILLDKQLNFCKTCKVDDNTVDRV